MTAWGLGGVGPDSNGYHDYWHGYNMVNSEMGHLYYESLGSLGYYAEDATAPQDGWGLKPGPFSNLLLDYYFSGTLYSPDTDDAWSFDFIHGDLDLDSMDYWSIAMAVHPGTVSAVPIASTVLLLASGLIGLMGFFLLGAGQANRLKLHG